MTQLKLDSDSFLGKENYFATLLIALLVLFLILPLFAAHQPALAVVSDLVFAMLMLAVIYTLSENRKHFYYALLLGLPAILLRGLFWVYSEPYLWVASFFFGIGLLLFSALKLLSFLMQVQKVNQETINAALCVYLSLGVAWGMIYVSLETLYPGAFQLAESAKEPSLMVLEMLYYSIVTMSTLGYGDITPVTPFAKNLSALEAIVGQIYLTVLVARLVSLKIPQEEGNQS